ncbi:hypothetical protein I302_106549 [Kwoniella bestiolae CBS 10118]|uniref:Uncharacterized protein n=1 Tax=Kwoniella bestiolae CBS 10118 TaxID=1296100 RepID=A0A1B9G143_9TREE|nr:hypothetical protein I302_06189 [Kwoniella bestiolae CBS 10118]OCF24728.1 hypothetical protein I302_06189 [Kwoniella bestiolae CBS 10118]
MSQPSPIPKTTTSLPSEPTNQTYWALPNTIEPVQVLPDRHTKADAAGVENMKGKESDPSRMGVYVCLLDDRPHLHPSLLSLHKHRLNIHKIPLPPDPTNDLPTSQSAATTQTVQDEDITMSSSPVPLETETKAEWIMWKFTEEEENRRKSYLPLA